MTSDLDSTRPGPAERSRLRRFYIQYLTAAVLFCLTWALATSPAEWAPSPWSTIVDLIPLLPAAWLFVIGVRYVVRSDEFEQRVALRAAGIAFVATLAVALVLAALDNTGVEIPAGYTLVFVIGLLVWGAIAFTRYRR